METPSLNWQQETDPVNWLRSEYLRKRSINQAYSLRAFARQLSINSGRLSDYLSKKRPLTPKMGERIASKLSYPPEKQQRFIELLELHRRQRKTLSTLTLQESEKQYIQLHTPAPSQDAFHFIADWYYFAIVSLIQVKDFQSDTRWIANRLWITVFEVQEALERMERIGVLERREGVIKLVERRPVTTGEETNSVAVNTFHRATLEKAINSIDDVALELRDYSAMTMAINTDKLPEAKKIIKNFRRSLCDLLEDGTRSEVYNLNIVLFPLTKSKTI